MKILAIIGSPRKKHSYEFIKEIESKINKKKNVDFDYIFLGELKLNFCRGCGICKNDENLCAIKDDFTIIKDKLLNCDGIIFSSPVYSYRESALMKNFLDRFHYFHFRPIFFNKPALILSTTGKIGLKEVINYLTLTAISWGFNVIGDIGIAIGYYYINNNYKNYIENKLEIISDNLIKSLENNTTKIKPTLNELLLFKEKKELVISIKNKNEKLYKFWESNNWINYYYYYKIKINFITKLLLKYKKFNILKKLI